MALKETHSSQSFFFAIRRIKSYVNGCATERNENTASRVCSQFVGNEKTVNSQLPYVSGFDNILLSFLTEFCNRAAFIVTDFALPNYIGSSNQFAIESSELLFQENRVRT